MFLSEKEKMSITYIKCAAHACGAHNMNSMKRFTGKHGIINGEKYDSNAKTFLMTFFV